MNEDVILKKLNEHDKRFDTLEGGFQDFKHQMYTTQDQILTIVKRLDEEKGCFPPLGSNGLKKRLLPSKRI